MLRRLWHYFCSIKLMNQVFLLNALVMFLTLLCVWLLMFSNMWGTFAKNEIAYTGSAVVNLKDYFLDKENFVYQTAREGLRQTMFPEGSGYGYFEALGEGAPLTDEQMKQLRTTFVHYMEYRFASENNLTAILFYSADEDLCYPFSRMGSLISSVDTETVQAMRAHLEKPTLSVTLHPAMEESYSRTRSYSLLLNLRGVTGFRQLGTLKHDFSVQSISDYIGKYYVGARGQFLITDGDDRILYDSTEALYESRYPVPKLTTDRNGFPVTEDGRYFIVMDEIRHLDVRVYGIISSGELRRDFMETFRLITVFYLILFALFLFVTYKLNHKRSEQIACITSVMHETRSGDLSSRIPPMRSRNELNDIAQNFNETLDDLERYIHEAYALELSNKQFQLMTLQAQVNPHFLYNTLEVIRLKALTSGSEEAAEMTYILSRLLRSSIKASPLTTISEEVEHCKDYLRLYEIRYPQSLVYDFAVDDAVGESGIIRNILQPVIENFIVHGFDSSRGDNTVSITIRPEGDCIMITVVDNGPGMPPERLAAIHSQLEQDKTIPTESVGLANIHQRIRLVYGKDYGLTVLSGQNGTTVSIRVRKCTLEELVKRV